jgi:hypothetical protein
MAYWTTFEASGIHHSNLGLQMTHYMYVAGFLMLLFDLTPDLGAFLGHISHPDVGKIRVELKFKKASPDAITCILYLECDNWFRIDCLQTLTTEF